MDDFFSILQMINTDSLYSSQKTSCFIKNESFYLVHKCFI